VGAHPNFIHEHIQHTSCTYYYKLLGIYLYICWVQYYKQVFITYTIIDLDLHEMFKYEIEKRRYIDAVKNAYGSYVERGGDGNEVLKLRGETLGYDESFFRACNMMAMENDHVEETEEEAKTTTNNNEDEQILQLQLQSIQKLFVAFCGSGCPLRIDGDKHLPKEGDVVVDLGCGAGHDSILAGGVVGPTGRIFGVDCTQAMLDQSQQNVDVYTKESMFAPFTFCRGRVALMILQNF